jgi:hypothetical protein
LACALVGSLWSGSAVAQQPASGTGQAGGEQVATPSARETKLNEEAVLAIINEEYGRAVALLEESRTIGESNVLYLNLGRAYQGLGRCDKAREMLAMVATAPRLADPPATVVEKKAQQYLGELDAQCPATEEAPKDEAPRDETEQKVEPKAEQAEPVQAPEAPAPRTASNTSSNKIWGWTAIGAGVALGGTALALELSAGSKRDSIAGPDGKTARVSYAEAQTLESDANTLSTVALGCAIAGGVSAGVGLYLLLGDAEEAPQASVSVGWSAGAPAVLFDGRW